jgi:16S rRNA (guanine527-N7)-methyltransferase|tara:strand:- start:5152 stop:5775 length:624 start_codon:yes stop_codon:yes gene_type:complete
MNIEEVQFQLINNLKFSKEAIEKLSMFHNELIKYNKKYNFISKSTEIDIWKRHILDSAQIVKFISFNDGSSLADMGSGAGFPGIVLSIFNNNTKFHVKLYEKSNVKCDFLENMRYKLGLEYEVFGDYKNEELISNYVVCRAFKKLEEIIRISREKIKVNHKLIILKGRKAKDEINKLQQPINFMYKLENSITEANSKILIIDIKNKL